MSVLLLRYSALLSLTKAMQTCVGSKAFFGNYTVSVPVEAGFDMFTSFDAFIVSQTGGI